MKGLPKGLVTNCTAKIGPVFQQFPQVKEKKPSKYRAIKTTVGSFLFDSKREAERYAELRLMRDNGKISDLAVHPEYLIQQAVQGPLKVVRPIIYEADFRYVENGKTVVEDVKGFWTPASKLKVKMFQAAFPDIEFRIVK